MASSASLFEASREVVITSLPTSHAAAIMLASVIGGLLEDHAHDALSASAGDVAQLAARLERLGGDISALAAAMQVLVRQRDY